MKGFVKSIIPKLIIPITQKIYWLMFGRSSKSGFSDIQFKDLEVLKCAVSYNEYGGYCIPLSSRHRPAARKVLTNGVYEPETIEFIRSNCANGDVVHAGTYFGDFLPALSEGISPGAKVWAFEPNEENFRCAKITLEINGSENVVLNNAGLGSKRECLFIQTVDENGGSLGGASRIISEKPCDAFGVETVQIVDVDSIVDSERKVSIIQLDVEGHEKEALIGALQTIKRCLPIIILEVLPNGTSTLIESHWFSENILSLGYRKIKDVHRNSVFSCEA